MMKLLLVTTIVAGNLFRQGRAGFMDFILQPLARYYLPALPRENGVTYFQEDAIGTALAMTHFYNKDMYFVALFKYRAQAAYEDGRATNLTGFDADKIYTRTVLSELLPSVGGELKFIADIEPTSITGAESYWDSMAVLHFPNSFAFGVMTALPKFRQLGVHKKAGLEDTAVFACEAMLEGSSSLQAILSLEDEPKMDTGETPLATVNFLKYRNVAKYQDDDAESANWRPGKEAVELYDEVAVDSEMEYGMRTAMRFALKYPLVKTDLAFDELRIDTYPSHTALNASKTDPALDSVNHHFLAGVQNQLAMQATPMFVNSLGGLGYIDYVDACGGEVEIFRSTILEQGMVDITSYCPYFYDEGN